MGGGSDERGGEWRGVWGEEDPRACARGSVGVEPAGDWGRMGVLSEVLVGSKVCLIATSRTGRTRNRLWSAGERPQALDPS